MRVDRKKLAVIMIEHDINVSNLAQSAGLSRATISSIRSGKSCSQETIHKLAQALKVSEYDLQE